jgi:mannuronan 5-epimerase
MWITNNIQKQTNAKFVIPKCLSILSVTLVVLFALFSQSADANRLYTPQQNTSATGEVQSKEDSKSTRDTTHVAAVSSKLPNRITALTAASDPQLCIQYDSFNRMITVTCESANLSHIDSVMKDSTVLKKYGDGVWLLNANLTIADGANFVINSNDTNWLKINSTTGGNAYHIYVKGNLDIDSVKLSSWNTTSDDYSITDVNTPRASITIQPKGTGKTNIFNSDIGYLGDGNTSRGQGLSYWSADGSVIRNNTIHDMYYGFYSERVGNITIENNTIRNDIKYGIDPHTGTHDMIIRNNKVHDNGHIGIICSLDCNNITIEGNTVYNNTRAGIMLSKNVQNSVVRNNIIHGEDTGISVSESSKDLVHSNVINNSLNGIQVKLNSSANNIQNNSIYNSEKCGIQISDAASRNLIMSNVVLNSTKNGVCIFDSSYNNTVNGNTIDASGSYAIYVRDSNSPDNVVSENLLLNVSRNPIRMINGTVTAINNTSPIN